MKKPKTKQQRLQRLETKRRKLERRKAKRQNLPQKGDLIPYSLTIYDDDCSEYRHVSCPDCGFLVVVNRRLFAEQGSMQCPGCDSLHVFCRVSVN